MTITRPGLLALAFLAACGDHAITDPPANDPAAGAERTLVVGQFYPVSVPTYDGSGEFTEPSVVRADSSWRGWRYWMAFVPYPRSDETKERPSIAVSDNGETWRVPAGVTNPLDTAVGLSDPTLALDSAAGEMRLYYRYSFTDDEIRLLTSADGVQWSKAGTVLRGNVAGLVQPSITRSPAGWELWTVDANLDSVSYPFDACNHATRTALERRVSADGVTFGAPDTVPLTQPSYVLWHVSVRYARGRYWALYAAFPDSSSCGHTSVFLATSADAVTWTVPAAPLGTGSAFAGQVYQSALVVRDSTVRIWFTGTDAAGHWHSILEELAAP